MNASDSPELRILVERTVRPVRASIARKMQMREELLAHLVSVLEEGLANQSNAQLAFERTKARFGNPAELTAQLQGTVSRASYFRSYLDVWWGCPAEEFTPRGTARFASRAGLAAGVLTLLLLFPITLVNGEFGIWRGTVFSVGVALAIAVFTFGLLFLSSWMHHALSRRLRHQVIAIVVLSGLLIPTVTFALCAAVSADVAWSIQTALGTLPGAALAMPILVIGIAYALGRELRAQQEWSTLAID